MCVFFFFLHVSVFIFPPILLCFHFYFSCCGVLLLANVHGVGLGVRNSKWNVFGWAQFHDSPGIVFHLVRIFEVVTVSNRM